MKYEQKTGKLRDSEGSVVAIGYSGSGEWKNNPEGQGMVDLGPIPQGVYTIEGPPVDTTRHGPFTLRLSPDEATRVSILSMGRNPDTFLCHGDSIEHPGTASEGCLILDRGTRNKLWENIAVDNTITVVSGDQQ